MPAGADLRSYVLAVEQAHSLVREGINGRSDAARLALAVLIPEVGDGQPEIVADLNKNPPDLFDADKRLSAVAASLGQPGDVANPDQAKAELKQIMAQPRYSNLHSNDSLWNRFWNWVDVQIFQFLSTLQLGGVPTWFWQTVLAVAALVAAVVTLLIVRTGWTQAGRNLVASAALPPKPGDLDRFAEADAAAAGGDYAAALRSLVAAVATAVSGKPYWETSPLTVRELFRASGKLDQLRPLLLAFELAVYGFRPVEEATYRRLADLAKPFRVAAKAGEDKAA